MMVVLLGFGQRPRTDFILSDRCLPSEYPSQMKEAAGPRYGLGSALVDGRLLV